MAIFRSLISTLLLIAISSTFTFAQPFRCTSPGAKCDGLVDYVSPNQTTLYAIKTLFQVKNLRSILGANNLPLDTPANTTVAAKQTIKIPFPCICRKNTGISNRRPYYTVIPDDGLYHIAAEVFAGLVTFPQIQEVNNISNPNLILAGQKLWIPLPCSCDDVDGQKVVHYGYVVPAGSSVGGIAQQFNTSQDTLLRLNNLTSPKDLDAGAVLDVPLRACSSVISNNSLDYPLLVPNGTYVFTANNCVRCSCDAANNWMLQCESSLINSSCSAVQCDGPENLSLGNSSSSGCNHTTCTYAGYNRQEILTAINVQSTCAAYNNSSAISLQGLRWNFLRIFIHILLICLPFLK
ncbi:lysM domain-containing GPI-anchored 2 [Olea europaea subsp. europaea]|uniref:LysM domain-containing GPI-anchored 2 n=1 Tax=Olea europaea subsp. europaea TaxID=158383 RepID=A0A8S0SBK9_OLEEU|nr:lysM domain-containing GPI-anchored 2 [Olea europaea subsp. europaea]CAA2989212.1 lysM domain-containing GPI-anchored 2 [Olea europaea subsp. europaea]CAA2989213.1 lysM domain-containing GPI-anchored 2 [Olea europaea subsp. europaea]CAA2989215.1 lysM domain-containing GPI-anchored 2 [Olea europaea subsp. europaea]